MQLCHQYLANISLVSCLVAGYHAGYTRLVRANARIY